MLLEGKSHYFDMFNSYVKLAEGNMFYGFWPTVFRTIQIYSDEIKTSSKSSDEFLFLFGTDISSHRFVGLFSWPEPADQKRPVDFLAGPKRARSAKGILPARGGRYRTFTSGSLHRDWKLTMKT